VKSACAEKDAAPVNASTPMVERILFLIGITPVSLAFSSAGREMRFRLGGYFCNPHSKQTREKKFIIFCYNNQYFNLII
jgi:hypothetical protein